MQAREKIVDQVTVDAESADSTSKKIKSIYISWLCDKTDPCGHNVTINYVDSSQKIEYMDAIIIAAKYMKYLSVEDQQHLSYVTEKTYWQYRQYLYEKNQFDYPGVFFPRPSIELPKAFRRQEPAANKCCKCCIVL